MGASQLIGDGYEPVTEIELEHGVSANIYLRRLAAGLITVYEEHATRAERGLSLEEWERMDLTEKALIVALRRVRIATENLQAEAQIAHAEAEARRKTR